MYVSASLSQPKYDHIERSVITEKNKHPPIELIGGSFKVSSGLWISPTDTLTTAANQMLAVQADFINPNDYASVLEFDASWGALSKHIADSGKTQVDYTAANASEWQKKWLSMQLTGGCNHVEFNISACRIIFNFKILQIIFSYKIIRQ